MDQKAIEADIKNYKVREGPLYKRSKFLKEWRQRWVVLTTNNLYTFTSKNLDEVTDVVDLKDMKSYKSYLRKDQEMIPPGFKIRTGDDMYYFCAKNCGEKWSWIVTLERLMDYKYVGTSNYNNADWIKTRGFQSQLEFQGNKGTSSPQKPATQIKQTKKQDQPKKDTNEQIEKMMKQIEKTREQLEKRKLEIDMKQASIQKRESDIVIQLKKIDQLKKSLAQQNQQFIMRQAQSKKVVQQPKQPQKEAPKQAPKQIPSPTKVQNTNQPSVSSLRSMFENQAAQNASQKTTTGPSLKHEQKVENKKDDIHMFRSEVVHGLFEEYRKQLSYSNAIRYVTQFLVNVGSDEKCGYSAFVVREGKANPNNKMFAEVFIELLSDFNNYDKCQNLMKFYEICIFQMPTLFNEAQMSKGQVKLKEIFSKVQNEQLLSLVMKNMLIMNKIKRFHKPDIQAKLQKLIKEAKNQTTRSWANKLRDSLDK